MFGYDDPMYELIIIGAGPGGIALAAEAYASGIDQYSCSKRVAITTAQSVSSIPTRNLLITREG